MPRPKLKLTKGDQLAPKLLELMANDRQSQAGHMLLNLSSDPQTFITEVSRTIIYHFITFHLKQPSYAACFFFLTLELMYSSCLSYSYIVHFIVL